MFFSTVLNALNATMPTVFKVALLNVCSTFAEDTFDMYYKLNNDEESAEMIKRLWGNDTVMPIFNRKHKNNSSIRYTVALHAYVQ